MQNASSSPGIQRTPEAHALQALWSPKQHTQYMNQQTPRTTVTMATNAKHQQNKDIKGTADTTVTKAPYRKYENNRDSADTMVQPPPPPPPPKFLLPPMKYRGHQRQCGHQKHHTFRTTKRHPRHLRHCKHCSYQSMYLTETPTGTKDTSVRHDGHQSASQKHQTPTDAKDTRGTAGTTAPHRNTNRYQGHQKRCRHYRVTRAGVSFPTSYSKTKGIFKSPRIQRKRL